VVKYKINMNKYVCIRKFFNFDFVVGTTVHYLKDEVYFIQENKHSYYKIEPDDKYIIYDLNNNEMSKIGEDLLTNFKLFSIVRQERIDSIFDDK